jgi:hypothetical protein
MELEVTWKRAAKVWWAYLWRNIIAIIVAMMGVSSQTIQFITAPIGMIIGLLISIVPVKMILVKDYGEFRLVLLQTNPAEQSLNKAN